MELLVLALVVLVNGYTGYRVARALKGLGWPFALAFPAIAASTAIYDVLIVGVAMPGAMRMGSWDWVRTVFLILYVIFFVASLIGVAVGYQSRVVGKVHLPGQNAETLPDDRDPRAAGVPENVFTADAVPTSGPPSPPRPRDFVFTCLYCFHTIAYAAKQAGRTVSCPNCQRDNKAPS